MATFNLINRFVEDLAEKVHNLATDTTRLYLTNTAPVAGNSQFGSPPEIAAGNGYTACGINITISASSQTAGVYKLDVTGCDPVFAAAGGTVGPFQYVVWYNFTATGSPLIGWWDYGSAISLLTTETLTVDFSAANGILQISA